MLSASMADTNPRQPLSEKKKAALLRLLADKDPGAIHLLEEAFLAKGADSLQILSELSLEAPAPARKNAAAILLTVQRQLAREQFTRFCAQGSDLEEGVFLLAHTRYPAFARDTHTKQLDEFAETLRPKVDTDNAKQCVEEMNQLLFGVLGFRGNVENYYDPDNSFINRVLDRRSGIPITLSAVYLFVAWRLDLPFVGVGMPGHFVLKWHHPRPKAGELFVDPFNEGRILTKDECVAFLTRNGHQFSDDMLAAVTARQILARMCNNLVAIYRQEDEPQLASQYEEFAAALSQPER
jgi:regulator of sirC expression with transglutaminase-like and TPR domain